MRKLFTIIFSCFLIFAFGQTLAPPKFSKLSGFYDDDFDLTISHEDSSLTIIYTIDGSEPDINNLNGKVYQYKKRYPQNVGELPYEFYESEMKSILYEKPIKIYDRTKEDNVLSNISTTFDNNPYFPSHLIKKSFVIKAKALSNENSSETISKTFFVNNKNSFNYTLPIFSISIDAEELFGYENGLWVAGKTFDDWRIVNPDKEAMYNTIANYQQSGKESERKVFLSIFDNNEEVIHQTIGIRNHGNATRSYRNKSFRFYAKSDYSKNSLNYNFFKDYDYNKFKRLILRNSGNDTYFTMYKDALIQTLTKHLNFETQEYSPSVVFVNSEYYGVFNLRERFDEKYFERIYNIKENEIDFLENEGYGDIGDPIAYKELMNFIGNNDLTTYENYNYVSRKIDFDNLIDYFLTEIYIGNDDWPANNNEFWRKKVDYDVNAPYGHDGKWRWVLKDTDLGMFPNDEKYKVNSMYNATDTNINPESNHYNLHFVKLLENRDFKNRFINRFSDLLNTTFIPDRVIKIIDKMKQALEPEMQEHIDRWKMIGSVEDWNNYIEKTRNFARNRPQYQKEHLSNFFNLEGNYKLTTRINNKEQGFVKVNTIEINNSTVGIEEDYQNWSGDYFKSIPVTLEAIALPGYKFSHWEGDLESNDQKIIINPSHNFSVKAIFEKTLGVGDLDKVDFIIYPNPVQEILNVASSSKSKIEYKISNIIGQIVEHNSTNNQQIDVSKLKYGVYIIQLIQDNKRITKKFIKK